MRQIKCKDCGEIMEKVKEDSPWYHCKNCDIFIIPITTIDDLMEKED